MSPKSVSKTSSFRAVSKVARELSFKMPKPYARATSLTAAEEPQSLVKMASCRLLPSNLSNLVDVQQQQFKQEFPDPKLKKLDPEIEDAKHRMAQRFLLKRTKRFSGSQDYLLQCPVSHRSRVAKSLMSIKDTVESSISNSLSKTKTLVNMTSTIVNTLSGCLGSSARSSGERGIKRKRDCDSANLTTYTNGLNLTRSDAARKKDCEDNTEFAKPKVYKCEYCVDKRFFHHTAYFKHLRHHQLQDIVRCRGCNKRFDLGRYNINDMRRHELKCAQRISVK